MGDRETTIRVFSEKGRLFQVEYTFQAVKGPPHVTAVGVASESAVVIACQRKVPDKLIRAEDVTQTFRVTDDIFCTIIGRAGDVKPKLYELRQIAESFAYKFGHDIPIDFLAKKAADKAQVETQLTYIRLLGVTTLLLGVTTLDDGTRVPQLWKVDPSGVSVAHIGAAVGHKDVEAQNQLEKRHRSTPLDKLSGGDAVVAAVGALQGAVGQTFKTDEVEDQPQPRMATREEVDRYLTDIAERAAS